MSERIERAALEQMAGAVPVPLGLAPEPEPRKYPYNEVDAQGYASMITPVLVVWSSRWKSVEKMNQDEIDMLSTAGGRFIAWRFPSNGEEMHPGAALVIAALAVGGPRMLQLWMMKKDAEEAAAAKKKEGDKEGGNDATQTH